MNAPPLNYFDAGESRRPGGADWLGFAAFWRFGDRPHTGQQSRAASQHSSRRHLSALIIYWLVEA